MGKKYNNQRILSNWYNYVLFFIFLSFLLASAGCSNGMRPIQVGNKRQLFIDEYIIENKTNLELFLHSPQKKGTVITFDKDWEGAFASYMTVLKDSIYRLYYRGYDKCNRRNTTCYAESVDGIHWEKPDLGLYEVCDTLSNNVIMTGNEPFEHNFSPFIDTNPNVPADQKYKAIAGRRETGLVGFVSADGIVWEKFQKAPIITQKGHEADFEIFDSQNVAFWSETEQKYICYFRTWKKHGSRNIRTVSRTSSKDFINWSEPEEMEYEDVNIEHIYVNQTHPYFRAPQIYISTAARIVHSCNAITPEQASEIKVNERYAKDCTDIILMSSRGGNSYDRTFPEAFIKPEIGYNNWTSRTNFPVLNVVQTSDHEMSLYVQKNYGQPSAHLNRYTLRLDGFASVRAKYQPGEFITKPFIFEGEALFINYATSAAGYIKVELLDTNQKPIKGFSINESKKIIGNEIERLVEWDNNIELESLQGKTVRLRFFMREADLYSFKFD